MALRRIALINKTHFADELRTLGHEVATAVPKEEYTPGRNDAWSLSSPDAVFESGEPLSQVLARLPEDFVPDVVVYFDDSSLTLRVHGWSECKIPTIFYSVDTHIHFRWHPIVTHGFDQILVAQRDLMPHFTALRSNVHWFPLWAPKALAPDDPKSIDVCFRGGLDPVQRAERVRFLSELNQLVPLDAKSGPYEEDFCRSKIVLNECISGDLNFRVFEALMCGALLVTPRTGNGLEQLFTDGEHLVTYSSGNADDAAKKISYYLAHEQERSAIATQGRACVLRSHTALARAQTLSGWCQKVYLSERPLAHFAEAFGALFSISEDIRAGNSIAAKHLNRGVVELELSFSEQVPEQELLSPLMSAIDVLNLHSEPARASHLAVRAAQLRPDSAALQLLAQAELGRSDASGHPLSDIVEKLRSTSWVFGVVRAR